MNYVRTVDLSAFPEGAYHYDVIANRASGLDLCISMVSRLPAGAVNPSGLHIHPVDQFFYVLEGTLSIQLGTKTYTAGPDTLVFVPAGLPHNNWNDGPGPEVHFEMMCPHPKEGEPASVKGVEAKDLPNLPDFIRPLDRSKFDPRAERLSELNLAGRDSGVHSLSWNVFRVPPGGGVSGTHIHGFTHIYYQLSGTMTLQLGIDTYALPPHTLGIVPAGMVHVNSNNGAEIEYHLNIRIPEPDSPRMQGMRVQLIERA